MSFFNWGTCLRHIIFIVFTFIRLNLICHIQQRGDESVDDSMNKQHSLLCSGHRLSKALGLWHNHGCSSGWDPTKAPQAWSTNPSSWLCQLGKKHPWLFPGNACQAREWDGPSRALLWEAGVHPALGPPSGAMTMGAVFPNLLQVFPTWVWHIWKTPGMIIRMMKLLWCSWNISNKRDTVV